MKRHDLTLLDAPFEAILSGKKRIELRLLDEKRKKISVGDLLLFHRAENAYDIIKGRVVFLYTAENFQELYQKLPLTECGYREDEIKEDSYLDMNEYYSLEKQKRYEALGIAFEVLNEPYLVDAHMHLEYGELSEEYVDAFIREAVRKGLDEINILDHTHRFKEFQEVYAPLRKYPQQDAWLNQKTKFCSTLEEYEALIRRVKEKELPLRVKFGLEVCYTKESEPRLREILSQHSFDFLTGAVHSVNGILYDMPFSKELLWEAYPVDTVYSAYYQAVKDCISSGLFDRLAHPDTIKMFHYKPSYDLKDTYVEVAKLLKEQNMFAESNTGAHYRYQHEDIGLGEEMLDVFIKEGVPLITASDAHHPQDVGSFIREAAEKIREGGRNHGTESL